MAIVLKGKVIYEYPPHPGDPLSLMAFIDADEYFQKFRETLTL